LLCSKSKRNYLNYRIRFPIFKEKYNTLNTMRQRKAIIAEIQDSYNRATKKDKTKLEEHGKIDLS